MNEALLIRFQSPKGPLTVKDFKSDEGVTFDHHPDASPLNFAIGFRPLLPGALELVRARHDWRNKEFGVDVKAESGGLRVSGFQGDPEGLPASAYDLTIELESYRFKDDQPRVVIHDGGTVNIQMDEKPDPRQVQLRNNFDPLTAAVIAHPSSRVDRAALAEWLASDIPRASRKACLLNLLCKLRTPPAPAQGFAESLTSLMDFVFFADVDRAYAAFRPKLHEQLETLVAAGVWAREGAPGAPIHRRLLDGMSRIGVPNVSNYQLISYRQGGAACLQLVIAKPPMGADGTVYADIDIDLGNPLWDLAGLIVHIGELLDSGRTDHFALRKRLVKGDTKDFVFYDIV